MTRKAFEDLIQATLREDIKEVDTLLNRGVDVNMRNEAGETAFSYACAHDKLKSAKHLFSKGADINTVDLGGGSPLDWAVCWSSPELRKWLVTIGAKRHDDSYEPWPWPPPGTDHRPNHRTRGKG